jgi:hypothetical protein
LHSIGILSGDRNALAISRGAHLAKAAMYPRSIAILVARVVTPA